MDRGWGYKAWIPLGVFLLIVTVYTTVDVAVGHADGLAMGLGVIIPQLTLPHRGTTRALLATGRAPCSGQPKTNSSASWCWSALS
jgi:hypothetical protein